MSNLVGENYGDDHSEQEAPDQQATVQQGTKPGEGKNDQPSTTGTHRGWGDPQPNEQQPTEDAPPS
jgi:hypothetical protein